MSETPVIDLDVTPNDRTWAALSWIPATPLWPLLAIIALVMEDTKDRPFVRQHALLSLVAGALLLPVTCVTLGLGGLLYLVFFYYAYQAYQGETVAIPVVSDFVAERGWV